MLCYDDDDDDDDLIVIVRLTTQSVSDCKGPVTLNAVLPSNSCRVSTPYNKSKVSQYLRNKTGH